MLSLLVYVTILLSLSSMLAVTGTWILEDIYINNRNYPGGPWVYFLATQDLPENVIFIVVLFVLTFLSDLLVVSLSVTYDFGPNVIALALAVLGHLDHHIEAHGLCYSGFSLPHPSCFLWYTSKLLVSQISTDTSMLALGTIWCLQSSQPGLSLYSKIPIAFGTSYYVTSLSVNVVVTILIVVRLALHRRSILENLPPEHAKHYLSVAAIVVESASLYSVFALAFIISYALNNPINQIFLTISSTCQVCFNPFGNSSL
jgi:uncharacterized membrane protein